MDFKITRIPPEGRNKYGNYLSSGNLTKMVVTYENNGNGTTNGNKPENNTDVTPSKNYTMILSHTQGNFEWDKIIANYGQTDTVRVLGYGELENIPTFVGNIGIDPTSEEDIASNRGYDVKDVPSGMTITVENNGTSAATIYIKVDETIEEKQGIIYIPCNIYTGPEITAPYLPSYDANGNLADNIDSADDYSDWNSCKDECKTLWLEYSYNVTMNAINNYHLELTNELAGINCDINGNILDGAIRPTCQAILYYGNTEVSGETYSISIDEDRYAQGVNIDTETGELTFGSNFSFVGTSMEIRISAIYEGEVQRKIMTITKQYPGKDGVGAVTRWLVPSIDAISYNPNTNVLTPSSITCKVMMQENENTPTEDTSSTIYYGWDTETPTLVYSSPISIQVGYSYISFALKNSNNEIYEFESIPILKEGKNGDNGSNGESVYNLVLSNNNASINCDSDGNILSTAYRPSCTAKLYYGKDLQTGATYEYTTNIAATGITLTQGTTGATITLENNFNFTADVLEIAISAKMNDILYGTAVMSINKNYAGKNGNDGADGTPGKDGVGISATAIQYGLSSSQAAQPSSWSDSVPTLTKGYYLWTKTTWTYTDGTTETGYQKTYISKDGNDGTDGLPGKDGVGISATTIEYGLSSSEDIEPSSWNKQVPALSEGYYLWTKTTWTYTDNTTEVGYQKTYIGTNGADGSDAITYWLDLSTTEIVVDTDGTPYPSVVNITAYSQEGGNTPTNITAASTIRYYFNTDSTMRYGSTISVFDLNANYIMVQLLYGGVIYDRQTIAILKDGKIGEQGLQGASIRGPYDWKNITEERRFCNGVLTDIDFPEDVKFIDVVKFDDTYYYCHTSYEGMGSETTAPSTTYWSASTESFDFIATNLLLAENGKINFASSNQLTLMDTEGNVTAGAMGGSGVTFWAGSETPSNANFQVDYGGNLIAKSGTFAGYIQMPYTKTSTFNEISLSDGYFSRCIQPGPTAYLIVDNYTTLYDGCVIRLPEPCEELNGFTYHIISMPNLLTKAGSSVVEIPKEGLLHSVVLQTVNVSKVFTQMVFIRGAGNLYDTMGFYTGNIVVTCVPNFGSSSEEWVWCVTQCLDVDCYENYEFVFGYNHVVSNNSIEAIYETSQAPDEIYNRNTLYINL